MSTGVLHIFPAIYLLVLHIAGNRLLGYNKVTMREGLSKIGRPPKGGKIMPVSKANQRAVNKYKKNNYDRIEITVPKGQRVVFQTHAASRGESVNGFITRAIQEAIARDTAGTASEAAGTPLGAGVVSLPSDALKAAQKAAEATGEALPVFVGRAVETQAQRDKVTRKMKGGG